ncbi:MAG: glycosyltransferase [Anaerolineaceae bacterium]
MFTENPNQLLFDKSKKVEILSSFEELFQKINLLKKNQSDDLLFTWIKPGDIYSNRSFEKLETALAEVKKGIIFYFDWITKEENETKYSPIYFPDFSKYLLFSINYLENSFLIINKTDWNVLVDSIQRFEENYIYGLIQNYSEYLIHIPEILCIRNDYAYTPPTISQVRELNNSVKSIRLEEKENHIFFNRKISKSSIIIPSCDNHDLLNKCINSILMTSANEDYEIIILDNSHSAHQHEMNMALTRYEKVKIYQLSQNFNYSTYNNFGSQKAQGDNLIFMNDDIEVLDNDWMNEILQWLDQPGVGIVGGCLTFPDYTIQHAGIIIGLIGHAGNLFRNHNLKIQYSPFGAINWYRNFYAVTGACLGIKKNLFEKVGGFNENYQLVYSDVALGIEVNNAGYDVIYNPFLQMIHYEGKTRRQNVVSQDFQLFEKEYKDLLIDGDKFYNKNLSYLSFDPKIKCSPELSPLSRIEKIWR